MRILVGKGIIPDGFSLTTTLTVAAMIEQYQIKFIPINYSLMTIDPKKVDNRIFLQGMQWAEPSESDFKKNVTAMLK